MVNYQNGKIYCIRSFYTDKIYIGSTCDKLSRRMQGHQYNFNFYINKKKSCYYTSFEIMKYGDAYIDLIEKFPCENKEQLRKREGYYIEKLNCVNMKVAGRTNKEKCKAYHLKNKDKIRAYKRKLNSIKHPCPCGSIYTSSHAARHRKTTLHRLFLLSLHNELNHLEL